MKGVLELPAKTRPWLRDPKHWRGFLLPALAVVLLGWQGPPTYKAKAEALSDLVEKQFWIPAKGQYTAFVTEPGEKSKDPAFAWDMAVQMSALAAACRVSPRTYRPLYDQAFQSLKAYGSVYQGVFGYGVWPGGAPPDRYYDDDEWIALAQLDAYDALHRSRDLSEAKKTFAFVMSGESSDLGGGIFWREQKKESKNTCSNAPAIAVAARLYLDTHDRSYLDVAKRLHVWVERLKDSDNLMFDSIGLNGQIGKAKWTYNTALMIRGDLLLYKATRDRIYLDEAVAMGTAAAGHWVDPASGTIHDEGPFAHHLAEAFLDLEPFDHSKPWREIALRTIDEAYRVGGKDGLFGHRWDRFEVQEGHFILLYQASMARALWLAAGSG